MWKCLKEYLREKGIECSTPLRCFKEAFKAGIIDEEYEEIFLEIIEKRNQIVHIYDSEQARYIYEFIKNNSVLSAIKNVYEKLKAISQERAK